MKRLVALGVAVVLTAFAGYAWAQAQGSPVKIGFNFVAAGKIVSSGTYSIEPTSSGTVVLRNKRGEVAAELKPLKSLGLNGGEQEPKLVFILSDTMKVLSEIWLPGQEGYLVGTVSGSNQRQIVGGSHSSK